MLVSCIMPTADRRRFIPDAIRRFLAQDYQHKELVVVDDGDDPVGDLVPDDQTIRYLHTKPRQMMGAKRNFCCSLTRGEIIAHWDDDDYYAPWRLSRQVRELAAGFDLCGLDRIVFYDQNRNIAWEAAWKADAPKPWVYGGTFCYRKSLWQEHPFDPAMHGGYDYNFVCTLAPERVGVIAEHGMYVALIHAANLTSYLPEHDTQWRQLPLPQIMEIMGEDSFGGHPGSSASDRQRLPR